MSSSLSGDRAAGRTLLVGFGKLGTRLVGSLRERGEDVIAIRRSNAALPLGVTAVAADVAEPLSALPAVDAMVVTLPPGERVDGYRRALSHISAALPRRPERTVFVSSTGVFAGTGPERSLTEQDEPVITSARAEALRDGELAAREFFDAVIVRPAGIYGPGRDFLIRRVRERAPVDHHRWTNRIHEADLVRTIDLLLRVPSPPPLVHAVDTRAVLLGEVVDHIAARLGVETPPDIGAERESGHVLDGALLHGLLGPLEYPTFESGYDAMLR